MSINYASLAEDFIIVNSKQIQNFSDGNPKRTWSLSVFGSSFGNAHACGGCLEMLCFER